MVSPEVQGLAVVDARMTPEVPLMQTLKECPTSVRTVLLRVEELALTGAELTDPITSPTDRATAAVIIVFLEAMA